MDEETNVLAYLLGGGGLTVILTLFLKQAWDWLQGRHKREREINADMATQRDDAYLREKQAREALDAERERANRADRKARLLANHANRMEGLLHRHAPGVDIPPWPDV